MIKPSDIKPSEMTAEEFILASNNTQGMSLKSQLSDLYERLVEDLDSITSEAENSTNENLRMIARMKEREVDNIVALRDTLTATEIIAANILLENIYSEDDEDTQFSQDILKQLAHMRRQQDKPTFKAAQHKYLIAKLELEK